MSNRAWMPLHIEKYLADTGHLTTLEHGAYFLLIMHYWRERELPTDERLIARISRMTKDEWAESRDVLAQFFYDGWRHRRIDEELAKADEIISKRKAAADAMHARKRRSAHAEQVQEMPSEAGQLHADHSADVQHMHGKCTAKNAHAEQVHGICNDTRVPPLTNNQNYTADARAIHLRIAELYGALGISDETKSPGLLSFSEPIQWAAAGCDIELDIIPALRSIAARGKVPKSWRYCSEAVFEARDRRLSPPPSAPVSKGIPASRKQTVGQQAREELKRLRLSDAPDQ